MTAYKPLRTYDVSLTLTRQFQTEIAATSPHEARRIARAEFAELNVMEEMCWAVGTDRVRIAACPQLGADPAEEAV